MPPSLRQLACECYSRLPSLGAGFSQGLKHTDSWEQELRSLLASLHSLLGGLYEGAEAGRARPADALGQGVREPRGAVRGPGDWSREVGPLISRQKPVGRIWVGPPPKWMQG